jgi:hypothetical protein
MVVNKVSLGMVLVGAAVLAFVVAAVLVAVDWPKHGDTVEELTLVGLALGFVGVKLP